MNAPPITAAVTITIGDFPTSQTASGKVAAPTIEPIEICRVQTTTATKTTTSAASAHGVRQRNAPTKLATAFPPLNLRNTGKACPAITASAATLIHNGSPPVQRAASHTAR